MLLGANRHAGKLALRHCRLAFFRRFGRSSHGREGDHGRHEIRLAVDQASKFVEQRKGHLSHLASRQPCFDGYNVDKFLKVHWDRSPPTAGERWRVAQHSVNDG